MVGRLASIISSSVSEFLRTEHTYPHSGSWRCRNTMTNVTTRPIRVMLDLYPDSNCTINFGAIDSGESRSVEPIDL